MMQTPVCAPNQVHNNAGAYEVVWGSVATPCGQGKRESSGNQPVRCDVALLRADITHAHFPIFCSLDKPALMCCYTSMVLKRQSVLAGTTRLVIV